MMEFTYSRAALIACGVILMSAFTGPFCDLMENETGEDLQELAESDARVIDRFWQSKMNELYLQGDSMLPSDAYTLTVEGDLLTITDQDGKCFHATLKKDSGSFVLSWGETVTISK